VSIADGNGRADGPGTNGPQRKFSIKDRKRLLRLFESRDVSQKQFARDQGIPISTLSSGSVGPIRDFSSEHQQYLFF
jgi:hypothetical protein